ncbi:hypothetical protein NEOLEDRAFT_1151496 [Neolentinus lepideus HHB14362 ss-1]|uniref:Uncharacterized protein n=1 Tax=Neolentinus lepideus HHB14362 ss-1 TaxID=1314782 RepID=A0A165NWD6_9AGAM|nr:hypothetical protein NEOLEDRAFT_1151496 [Neolentinus lepideus HHB14362 ss-1]
MPLPLSRSAVLHGGLSICNSVNWVIAMVTCEGCSHTFTLPGYTQHLRKTSNPPCRAIYEAQQLYKPALATEPSENRTTVPPPPSVAPPHFKGDLFGSHYTPEDFTNLTGNTDDLHEDGNAGPDDDSLSDDDDGDQHTDTHHWEPPPVAVTDSTDDDMVLEEDTAHLSGERVQASETMRKPAATVAFLSSVAGKPICVADASLLEYAQYAFQLRSGSADPWAPFVSKLDWDVAWWAKLHGPGSTALTELLQIEGIICMYYDMYTGKWWWNTQKVVESNTPGTTIIPVLISSDKTQVTLFGNKTAYPIYMTISNLPKEIR